MFDHAVYTIVRRKACWVVLRSGTEVAGFAERRWAECFVLHEVDRRCRSGQASQIVVLDAQGRLEAFCPCFDGPPPGTPRN